MTSTATKRRTAAQIARDNLETAWGAVVTATARITRAETEVTKAVEARARLVARADYAAQHPDLPEEDRQAFLKMREQQAGTATTVDEPTEAEEDAYRQGILAALKQARVRAAVSGGLTVEQVTSMAGTFGLAREMDEVIAP